MAASIAPASGVQSIVEEMIQRVTDPQMSRIRDLWHQLHYLRRHSLVHGNPEAITLVGRIITLIKDRDTNEPLPRDEQRFYNYSLELIDETAEKVDEECLAILKEIVFRDPAQVVDLPFDTYRTAMMQRQAIEREIQALREDVNSLGQRLTRYMTMTPLPMISIPATNGTHQIPEMIPRDATHILLYCVAETGSNGCDISYGVKLSNSLGHQYHFRYHRYGQNAWSYNSENIWLEICPLKTITIQGSGPCFSMCIIGYK